MEEADKSVLCRTEGHERSAAPPPPATARFPPAVRDGRQGREDSLLADLPSFLHLVSK
jgi:hypothetical protein